MPPMMRPDNLLKFNMFFRFRQTGEPPFHPKFVARIMKLLKSSKSDLLRESKAMIWREDFRVYRSNFNWVRKKTIKSLPSIYLTSIAKAYRWLLFAPSLSETSISIEWVP